MSILSSITCSSPVTQGPLPSSLIHEPGSRLAFLTSLLPTYIKESPSSFQLYFLNCFQIHYLLPILSIIVLNHYYNSLSPGLPASTCLNLTHSYLDTIHSFNKNFLGAYDVPSSALGSGLYLACSVILLKCEFDYVFLFSIL